MKNLFLLFCLCISSIIYAQNAVQEHINDHVYTCIECDSIYNFVCFPRDSLVYGEYVDVRPQFPGGESVLMSFIRENTKYPKEFANINFQGLVVVRFVINEGGKVICPRVVLSLYPEFDAEAIRVVKLLPGWMPPRKDYGPASFCYTVPVVFNNWAERKRDIQWIYNPSLTNEAGE